MCQKNPANGTKHFRGVSYMKELRLFWICTLVIGSHTATSYLEEVLFKQYHFKHAFFMVMIMCLLYSFLYILYKVSNEGGSKGLRFPVCEALQDKSIRVVMFWLCLAYACSNGVSKLALAFVSIPTQIVFKSCKLVAVMIGSSFILGKTYSFFEYMVAGGLVLGMILFAGADFVGGPSSILETNLQTIIGLLLLLLALCFDSVLGNLQEKVQKGNVCDEYELMFVQSIFSAFCIILFTAATGELQEGILECFNNKAVFVCEIAWGLFNMVGTVMLLKVAGEFSAVTAVLTSFIRKFSSLLFSYMLFPKPFTAAHCFGLVLVFGSIAMHAAHKKKAKEHNAHVHPHILNTTGREKGVLKDGEELQVLIHGSEE
uniref:Sugar phosphate transporter domain-containing protein n=1 Tax=Hanusia phi TaxID=3032 RepID=A0A6T7MT55_9CRYP|mmetsp:Transcript_14678/g.33704  ORF Transcript_14678/g.33704 Transcript_14678/m.33704 type:complete len:372 (+) Transcript_14678:107-1222(+)